MAALEIIADDSSERVVQPSESLPKIYPDAHCELDFRNPLELLVATILGAIHG